MTLPAQQAQVFAAMLLCSAALGAAWDALEAACRLCFAGRADNVLDLCFGPVWALGMIAAALRLQTEVFRLYVLLAAAAGVGLYFAGPGLLLRRAAAWAGRRRKNPAKDGI